MGKKRSTTKASSSSRPVISEDVGDLDPAAFNDHIGHHYDKPSASVPSKKRTIKAQSRDLFDDKEMGGWGMMMGSVEVVDASKYLVVRGDEGDKGKGDAEKKMRLRPSTGGDDSSDDEGNPDDSDPLDDCSISDEECDIVILNPGESKAGR